MGEFAACDVGVFIASCRRCGLDLDKAEWNWQSFRVSVSKLELLRELLRSYGSCLVAYSGGVDSVFLACMASEVLGERSLAVIADSPSLPRRELADAERIAEEFGIRLKVIRTKEFDNPEYVANPGNRCFLCKQELFGQLTPLAKECGFEVIVYGENASDAGDFRPGGKAAEAFSVRAPLKEVGLTKEEIRGYSLEMGLPTWDKPQLACLSSRIPHGEPVTKEKLRMVEEAENVLRDLGFVDVRVRHHEAGNVSGVARFMARIEVDSISQLIGHKDFEKLVQALKQVGYSYVTVDLEGYRRGSLNAQQTEPSPFTAEPKAEPRRNFSSETG